MTVITLGSNPTSTKAQRALGESTSALSRVSERLASGLRINRASDDAAGLAISSSLDARARIYTTAIRNGNDALSALNIADGALASMSSLLDRMSELATQAGSGILSSTQRQALNLEAQALQSEFVRLQATTIFNGISLVSNSRAELGVQLGIGENSQINLSFGISGTGQSSSTYSYFEGINPGTLASPAGLGGDYAVGDYDGDGLDDLIYVDLAGDVFMYSNTGSGFSSTAQQIASLGEGNITGITAGNLNGDQRADLVITTQSGNVHTVVDGALQTYNYGSAFNDGVAPLIVDFSDDGTMDVLLASGNTVVSLFGSGDGSLGGQQIFDAGVTDITSLAFSSLAGVESVLTSNFGSNNITQITGANGTFSSSSIVSNGYWVSSIADQDGDGARDFVVSFASGVAVLDVYGIAFNNLNFGAAGMIITGDFNGDGLDDIAEFNGSDNVRYLTGSGNGNFTQTELLGAPSSSGSVQLPSVGDVNGDGIADVLAWDSGAGGIYSWNSSEVTVNEGEDIPALNSFALNSAESARSALTSIQLTRDRILTTRGSVGTSMGRINVAINTLYASRIGAESASARIKDADMASETAQLTRLQILQRTGAEILSQANQAPALALQLLRT